MTDEQLRLALVANLTKQWVEDLQKKPSITDTQRYNQLVAVTNGYHTSGVWSEDMTPDVLFSFYDVDFGFVGFDGVDDVLLAHEADWSPTWPVPYA